MDPYWIKNDELIKSLYNKGSYLTEEEKVALIQKHIEICGKILSKHKEAQDRGQIEISVSPFYHPIIPLLCDTDSARQASPSISLPNRFVHPEDAAWQINSAVEYYEAIFGKKPQGMWPSEGSVSNEAVSIMAKAGIKWIATDEAVLYRSKYNVENTMQPNRTPFKLIINGQDLGLNIVFRNTNLSDSIGFVYSKWNAEDAANDFMNKLYSMRDNFKDDSAPLINVILDGENCWEYYKNDGWNFLTALYNKISADDSIETVRLSDYIKRFPTKNTVNDLTAGSWIYANFSIWIGHSEDNESWNRLNETRQFLTDYIDKNPSFKGSPEEKEAWENIYIAEGSDWNWWYGSEHHGANDAMFDFLFRQRLVKVYNCLGKNADVALYSPIKHLDFKNTEIIKTPSSFISPKINGKTGDYFKWKNAGYYKAGRLGGSMHQVSSIIDSFYYGFDFNNFYIRIDLGYKISLDILKTLSFNVIFISPVNNRISASFNDKGFASKITLIKEKTEKAIQVENAVYQDVAELKIPFRLLNLPENYKEAMFFITVDKDNMEVDRCPYKDNVLLPKPENKLFYANWNV
jgi:alpha-amylase/alpha-mannosidase (GH57 family)